MINKKIGCGLLCLMSLGLLACGGPTSTPAQTEDEEDYPQVTDPIEETMYNLAITGEGAFTQGHNWKPAECKDIAELHFTRVDKTEWKLENITLAVGEQFKFVFNDNWGGDFGYSGMDSKSPAYENIEDAGGNCKVKVAGTYDFFYHPLWVSDTATYAGSMAIKLHA